MDLDADPAFLVLDAADEKNRQGNSIPLRADLAADLRQWVADKAKAAQDAADNAPAVLLDPRDRGPRGPIGRDSRGLGGHSCLPLPTVPTLPPDTLLFDVPDKLVKILDLDLVAAGIARRTKVGPKKWKIDKRDDRGRTVDVHALRHTFGTLLSKGGVAPRTAQAAMRHSTINLTMNTYTDPKLLDVAGAMDALPALPLGVDSRSEAGTMRATGTDDVPVQTPVLSLVPTLVPTTGKSGILGSILDKLTGNRGEAKTTGTITASACPVKRNNPLTTAVNGLRRVETSGLEPPTPSLQS